MVSKSVLRAFRLLGCALALAYAYYSFKRQKLIQQKEKTVKVFLVTGAASGIAQRLVTRLIENGHSVVATDINYDQLAKSREEMWDQQRCKVKKLDVRKLEEWQDAINFTTQNFGRLDVLLNVAGYIKPGRGFIVDQAQVDLHIDVNMKGVIFGSQCAAEVMIKQGHGHIINVASLAGLTFVPGIAIYCASKNGVRGFSNSLFFELHDKGVHVTTVCPDAVQTPMLDKQKADENAALTFSMGKILTVDEVCDTIINYVLPYKPREVCLPETGGTLCKLMNLIPTSILLHLSKIMVSRGHMNQKKVLKATG